MARFVKSDVLSSATTYRKLTAIKVTSSDTTKPSSEVDIGVVTKRELTSLKSKKQISQAEKNEFQVNCKEFLVHTTEKLLEKSPLKFPVVKFLRCLDPQVMAGPIPFAVKLFERLVSCLIDA